MNQKDFETALAKVERGLTGPLASQERSDLVARLFRIASALHRARAYASALRAWNLYLEHQPDEPKGLQYRGRCFHHLGDYPRAIADFSRQIELTAGDRDAWISRAEAFTRIGDAERAAADQVRADAVYDFEISPGRLRRFRALRVSDPDENLAVRLTYFRRKDRARADAGFDFVPIVMSRGWACAYFEGDGTAPMDLIYTIGLYYRFGHPELHLVAPRRSDPEELKSRLNAIAIRIAGGHAVGAESEDDLRFHTDRRDILEDYPFGFGEYFYRHFADTSVVPLLMASSRP